MDSISKNNFFLFLSGKNKNNYAKRKRRNVKLLKANVVGSGVNKQEIFFNFLFKYPISGNNFCNNGERQEYTSVTKYNHCTRRRN